MKWVEWFCLFTSLQHTKMILPFYISTAHENGEKIEKNAFSHFEAKEKRRSKDVSKSNYKQWQFLSRNFFHFFDIKTFWPWKWRASLSSTATRWLDFDFKYLAIFWAPASFVTSLGELWRRFLGKLTMKALAWNRHRRHAKNPADPGNGIFVENPVLTKCAQ